MTKKFWIWFFALHFLVFPAIFWIAVSLGSENDKITQPSMLMDIRTGESLYIQNEIKTTVKNYARDYESCYADYLENASTKKAGAIKISWTILNTGELREIRIESNDFGRSEEGQRLGKCLIDKMARWNFPDPPVNESVPVEYLFKFNEKL